MRSSTSAGEPTTPSAAEHVAEHVRTSCAVCSDQQEPTLSPADHKVQTTRLALLVEAIRLKTPLDAERRVPDDLLLVLAFRWATRMVFKLPIAEGLEQAEHLADILHVEQLPDGTMLGNDAAGPGPGRAARGAGG
jgi:hypothetical protein